MTRSSDRLLQQQGRRGQDHHGLSPGVDVRRSRSTCGGGRSRSASEHDHGFGEPGSDGGGSVERGPTPDDLRLPPAAQARNRRHRDASCRRPRRTAREWKERIERNPVKDLALPAGGIVPNGYVVLRHSIRLDRPVQAFDKWIARIPGVYAESVLGTTPSRTATIDSDKNCIAKLKDYRSVMPLAQEARKPMFS